MAGEWGASLGAIPRGVRGSRCGWRRNNGFSGYRRAHQRQSWRSLPADWRGELVLLIRIGSNAARHRELYAERTAEQPEQPEREAAGVEELRARRQVRPVRKQAFAEHRDFPDRQQER